MQYIVWLLILVTLLVGGFAWLNRPIFISVDAEIPSDFPESVFSHRDFEELLIKFVDTEGNVDYESWQQSAAAVQQLSSYLAAVAQFSPDTSPERFATKNDQLAYWIYGYNAWVIESVLDHWPIDSVTDLKAPIEAITGLGFFHRQRFPFGGEAYSLLAVENNKIRKVHQDARIHFVLNCASDSCPVMRPTLPTGEDLQQLLDTATTDFVSDPKNVSIDHANKRIVLSTIFKWFRRDFINDLKKRSIPNEHGLADYVASVAPESLRAEIRSAQEYDIVFSDYDWSLNRAETH